MDAPRARRTLWLLAVGHLAIGIGALPVALLVGSGPHDMGRPSFVLGVIASGVLALGQVMSGLNVAQLAWASTDHIDTGRVARTMRRAEWTGTPTVAAIVVQAGLAAQAASLTPVALPTVAVLLEASHRTWLHRRARPPDGGGAPTPQYWLPPGSGWRTRARYGRSVVGCVLAGGLAAAFLVATTARAAGETHGATGAAAVQIVAAATVTVMPFLPIHGLLRLRGAVSGDVLHLPTLRHAGESVLHASAAAVVLFAVVMLAAPTTPSDAIDLIARPILATNTLVLVAHLLIEIDRISIGDIPRRVVRRR